MGVGSLEQNFEKTNDTFQSYNLGKEWVGEKLKNFREVLILKAMKLAASDVWRLATPEQH